MFPSTLPSTEATARRRARHPGMRARHWPCMAAPGRQASPPPPQRGDATRGQPRPPHRNPPRPPQAHDQDDRNGWREQQSRARLPDRRFAETVAGLINRTARPPSPAVMLGLAITWSSRSACPGPSSTRSSTLSKPRRSVAYPVGQLAMRTSSRTDCPTLDRGQARPQAR